MLSFDLPARSLEDEVIVPEGSRNEGNNFGRVVEADPNDPASKPRDRPEWSAVDPNGGDVYDTPTNNSDPGADREKAVNAANPR